MVQTPRIRILQMCTRIWTKGTSWPGIRHPTASRTKALSSDGSVKNSKITDLYGRLHADICNVSQFLLSGVRMHIRLTKAKDDFYLMNANADSKAIFKFPDAELIVRRIRPSSKIYYAHTEALSKGCIARYNLTRVELKTFTYAGVPQAIFINNSVLGMLPKRLIFSMVKNTDFLGSRNSNPYNLRHYDLTNFTM